MLYNDLGITDKEELDNHMTHERMIEFIQSHKVVSNHRDRNNYGEFRFVTIITPRVYSWGTTQEAITFYGNGTHEYRDITPSYWYFYVGNGCLYDKHTPLNKTSVIREINQERLGMSFDNTPKNNQFTFIAGLSDDDAAMVVMDESL